MGSEIIVASIIGAVAGVGSTAMGINAQEDRYEAQYNAEQQAAIANAEAALTAAGAEAEALLGAAEAQAGAIMGGAAAESEAAQNAADLAYGEAYKNVELMKSESDEALRKLDLEQTTYEEKAKARAAAGGGELTGTTDKYLNAMEKENTAQFGYLSDAYKNQQSVAMSNAAATKEAALGYANALMVGARAQAGAVLEGGHLQAAATTNVAQANYNAIMQAYGGGGSVRNDPYAKQRAAALSANRGGAYA